MRKLLLALAMLALPALAQPILISDGPCKIDGSDCGMNAAVCTPPLACAAGTWNVAITPTNPGGAVALQSTTPGTAQTGHDNLTGVRQGQIQDKGGQVFNVKAYGAVGLYNGTTHIEDDTAAIQAAINAAVAVGGTVLVPNGVFLISSTLTITGAYGVRLTGTGRSWTESVPASLLKWGGPINTPMVRLRNTFLCSVTHLGMTGSAVAGVTGLVLDSDGTTFTSNNHFDDLSIVAVAVGVQVGTYTQLLTVVSNTALDTKTITITANGTPYTFTAVAGTPDPADALQFGPIGTAGTDPAQLLVTATALGAAIAAHSVLGPLGLAPSVVTNRVFLHQAPPLDTLEIATGTAGALITASISNIQVDAWSMDHAYISGQGDTASGITLGAQTAGFSVVSNTSLMNCAKGIRIIRAGPMVFDGVNGYGPTTGAAFVKIEGAHLGFEMRQCQWETISSSTYFIDASEDDFEPIVLTRCYISQLFRFAGTNGSAVVLSNSCTITSSIQLGANTWWTSIGDYFDPPGQSAGSLTKGTYGGIKYLGTAKDASIQTTAFTLGSVLFASTAGLFSQDNANLFWDNVNKRLGIGTPAPDAQLTIISTTAGNNIEWGYSSGGYYGLAGYDVSGATHAWVGNSTFVDSASFGIRMKGVAAGNEALTVLGNGNVGLGITTPQSPLHWVGHATSGGTAPTKQADSGSCGTTGIALTGNDNAMTLTVGTVAATSCTNTFAVAWVTNAPVCNANAQTTATPINVVTSTTVVTVSAAALTPGEKIQISCKGWY